MIPLCSFVNVCSYLPVDMPNIPPVLNPKQNQRQNIKTCTDISSRKRTVSLRHFRHPPRSRWHRALLCYYAAYSDNSLSTFRGNLSFPYIWFSAQAWESTVLYADRRTWNGVGERRLSCQLTVWQWQQRISEKHQYNGYQLISLSSQ